MDISLVSAMSPDRVIGKDNSLPWSIPEEYSHFLSLVRGYPIFMGRVSEEIFGPDLPENPRWVLTRSDSLETGATPVASIEEAIVAATAHAKLDRKELIFCAGGGSVYRACLPYATRMDLSFVHQHPKGDTFFPEWDDSEWEVVYQKAFEAFTYKRFRRVNAARAVPKGES